MSDPYHGFQPTTLIWEPPPAAKCQDCGSDNNGDSLWVDQWCQECWERHCSQEWWDMLANVQDGIDKGMLSLD